MSTLNVQDVQVMTRVWQENMRGSRGAALRLVLEIHERREDGANERGEPADDNGKVDPPSKRDFLLSDNSLTVPIELASLIDAE